MYARSHPGFILVHVAHRRVHPVPRAHATVHAPPAPTRRLEPVSKAGGAVTLAGCPVTTVTSTGDHGDIDGEFDGGILANSTVNLANSG